MSTHRLPVRALRLLFALLSLSLVSACSSTLGGEGTLTITGPAGLWPDHWDFGALEDGEPVVIDWDLPSTSEMYGRAVLRREPDIPWRLSWSAALYDECCDGSEGFSISLDTYRGSGVYTDEEITVSYHSEEPYQEDPVTEEFTPGRMLRLFDAAACSLTIDADPQAGSMVCEEVLFRLEDEQAAGPYRLEAVWQYENTPYRAPEPCDAC